jgi:hypothetical protein
MLKRREFSKCADVQFYWEPLASEANRNVHPLVATGRGGPPDFFALSLGTNTAAWV